MKKVLFASAALIALGAGSAQATDPVKLDIGGYMNEWVGYATNKDSAVLSGGQTGKNSANVDVQPDVEIDFKGSTKLDNGLTVAVEVDTNGSQGRSNRSTGTNANGKRSFATVSGGFGALEVGEQDNVGALIHSGSPDVGGIGGQDGNWMNWVAAPAGHADTRQRTYAGDDRTENKVIYITPAFHGLSAGASYTPTIQNSLTGHTSIASNQSIVNGELAGDLYVYGLAYNSEIAGVTVKADLGGGNANVAGLQVIQGGLNLGYAGFTVGGSYINRIIRDDSLAIKSAGGQGASWDLGVSYVTGPYGVSLTYFAGAAANANHFGQVGMDRDNTLTLAGSYDLGPGVAAKASVFNTNWTSASGTLANKNDGIGVVTGITVAF